MTDDVANDAPLSPTKRGRPKPNALASKIKKLMQSDDDVGKIAQATPCLIGVLTIRSLQYLIIINKGFLARLHCMCERLGTTKRGNSSS